MKRGSIVLAGLLLLAGVFSQVSCKMAGPLARGQAGIQIGVASPGTRVYLDGKSIGTVREGVYGPMAYVAPGQHKLVAKAAGYAPFEMPVYAYAGQVTTYDLPLLTDLTPVGGTR